MNQTQIKFTKRNPLNIKKLQQTTFEHIHQQILTTMDICEGCRLCFNLCQSFETLFKIIDKNLEENLNLNHISPHTYAEVAHQCTLCDKCYSYSCPYTKPHSYELDFPHLMLQYKVVLQSINQPQSKGSGFNNWFTKLLSYTDFFGKWGTLFSTIFNKVLGSTYIKNLLHRVVKLSKGVNFPTYQRGQFIHRHNSNNYLVSAPVRVSLPLNTNNINNLPSPPLDVSKLALFTTCFVNYNSHATAHYANLILQHNSIKALNIYPGCCGMPMLEQLNLKALERQVLQVSSTLYNLINEGYYIISLTPTCTLMLKQEWPLLFENNLQIQQIAAQTLDFYQLLHILYKNKLLNTNFQSLPINLQWHNSCHASVQNSSNLLLEILKQIPNLNINSIKKCSGHGGIYGLTEQGFKIAETYGNRVIKDINNNIQAAQQCNNSNCLSSDCPLAKRHLGNLGNLPTMDPLEILVKAYNLQKDS